MKRALLEWSGPSIQGLAVSVLHFPDTKSDIVTTLTSFLNNVRNVIPSNVTVTGPGSGDVIDPSTGTLTDVWSEGAGVTVSGAGADDQAAAGVGACITWVTNGIVGGHRVRGRTFIVPLAASFYANDGTLDAAAVSELEAAGTVMTVGGLLVWHRPTTPLGSDGSEHDVVNYRLRDRVAYLSSRRD